MLSSSEFEVRLYSRATCCLCDEAERMLNQLSVDFDFRVQHIDIDSDPILKEKLCCQIPVVTIDGGNRVALRITLPRLRRAFARASQRKSQSEVHKPCP